MWTIISIFDANDKIQAFSLILFVYSNKDISTKLSNTTKKQTTTIHNSNGVSCLCASLSPTVTKSILSDALHYTGCHIIIDQIIWFDWIWIKWNTYYMLKRSVINLWHGMAWRGMAWIDLFVESFELTWNSRLKPSKLSMFQVFQ